MEFICDNISQQNGHLFFAGQDCLSLAHQYGTPLYLLDEDKIRTNCRIYKKAFSQFLPEGSFPLYASKACSFKQIYRIITEEMMGVDVVSAGEIHTAKSAGFDLSKAFFHGNNKTDEEISFAMENGIGYFVSDSLEEVRAIEAEAASHNIRQKILLRLTPGIDPHTYEAISTGKVDSKFGSPIETGAAEMITEYTLQQPHIILSGFHCHIGSQVFTEDVFERSAVVMLQFISEIKQRHGYFPEFLDLGGGYGIRYVSADPCIDIAQKIASVAATIHSECARHEMPIPKILMEPGRSIVANAGMTLYTVGSVKDIEEYRNYVSVDGGMTDNPRYALYRSSYTCYDASRMNEEYDYVASVVGKCCESGDIIQKNVSLPSSVCRGDILAVCTTGAYNYSMASNYNRLARPPVIMLKNGSSYLAVRRETLEDLVSLDL